LEPHSRRDARGDSERANGEAQGQEQSEGEALHCTGSLVGNFEISLVDIRAAVLHVVAASILSAVIGVAALWRLAEGSAE
jgi:hypothetical protein